MANDGETMETVTDFICLGSKITADNDCSHEIALWKKSNDKTRQHIKKQRHHFAYKICAVKAMVFPVVVYKFESWTIKKAEHQRTNAFKLELEKTLESPLDYKEIKSVNPKGNQL